MDYRIEKDTLGEVKVPADKLWGAQTERSRNNFKIGQPASMPLDIIRGFAYLKKGAAYANHELGVLPVEKRDLIAAVCDEILAGKLDDQFPLVIWQTGSGTQSNMNVNEVIANRAHQLAGKVIGEGEKTLLPNDDVNKSQSSNDTFPTGMHIACYKKVVEVTLPGLRQLHKALDAKAKEMADVVKIGRTHLMDATPLTLGQEFSGYAAQVEHGIHAIEHTLPHLAELALGGTAVGTGLNTPKGYDVVVARHIAEFTGLPFVTAQNKFEALAAHDAIVETHGALKQVAVSLNKIANDIRLLASGPRSGIGEIIIPANEPGSSIMPGKVNPVIAEVVGEACYEVIGNDVTIMLCSERGEFELNAFEPGIAYALFNSIFILENAMKTLAEKAIKKLTANPEACLKSVLGSVGIVTAFNPYIGYEKSASIAKEALQTGKAVGDICLERGYLSKEEIDKILEPKNMLNPSMVK